VTRLHRSLLIAVLLAATASQLRPAPPEDEIKKKQSQLEKLRKDIDAYEGRIKDREKKEHANLDLLDTYDRQAVLLRRLVRKLHEEEDGLEVEIDSTKRSVGDLNSQIAYLKNHYAHYVATLYKYGRTYDLELLLASKSFNQLLVRAEYLRRFSDQRKSDLDRIAGKKESLETQNVLLQQKLLEQRQLIADKKKEDDRLSQKMKKRKVVLAEIRRDKKNYQREINRKIEAAKDLEQLISKLVEEDRLRREREARSAKEKNPSGPARESSAGNAFELKHGSLRWPVSQGKVVAHFGAQQHPSLHTITQNTGIDISVPSGTPVNAVAEGEVSKIYWLPSFGNLVILNHNNGFLTVYAHLAEITVNEQQKVGEGEQIGTSGEALAGPMLHFEIYKGREKQDPEQWLHPRGVSQR
jgi:septal ring factor EnvC (AmiA/AmiB activator)